MEGVAEGEYMYDVRGRGDDGADPGVPGAEEEFSPGELGVLTLGEPLALALLV